MELKNADCSLYFDEVTSVKNTLPWDFVGEISGIVSPCIHLEEVDVIESGKQFVTERLSASMDERNFLVLECTSSGLSNTFSFHMAMKDRPFTNTFWQQYFELLDWMQEGWEPTEPTELHQYNLLRLCDAVHDRREQIVGLLSIRLVEKREKKLRDMKSFKIWGRFENLKSTLGSSDMDRCAQCERIVGDDNSDPRAGMVMLLLCNTPFGNTATWEANIRAVLRYFKGTLIATYGILEKKCSARYLSPSKIEWPNLGLCTIHKHVVATITNRLTSASTADKGNLVDESVSSPRPVLFALPYD